MRIPREIVLILAILVVVAVAAALLQPEREQTGPALVSTSNAPTGAHALYLWLEQLGYRVERMPGPAFALDESVSALFILAPTVLPSDDELTILSRWVESGGTLVFSGELATFGLSYNAETAAAQAATIYFLDAFSLTLRTYTPASQDLKPGQPLLLHPPVGSVHVQSSSYVTGTATGLISFIGAPTRPAAAGIAVGKGWVYVIADNAALSNQGLGLADNGALVLNWLPAATTGRVIFDELHHGPRQEPSLSALLVQQPWGWALLYSLGVVFLYLLLSGRHFGRPVPILADARRQAAEYVVSLAGLLRRGGKSAWVAQRYETLLRQSLAAACGADPTLGTPALAARLAGLDKIAGTVSARDAARVLGALHDGAQRGIAEERLVSLAAEADRIIKVCSHQGVR